MASSIDRFLTSSLGKKVVMSLTGFLLVGFLIMHLLGNLTLYTEGSDGFVEYADGMHRFGLLLYAAEIGLVLLFGTHIYMAVRLTKENRAARPRPYVHQGTLGESTPASRNMFITGSIVLGFLVIHLINFRFAQGLGAPNGGDLRDIVRDTLSNPLWAAIYIVGSIATGAHVSHGFKSAFQSLGANHPRLNTITSRAGLALAILFAIGFASFPIIAVLFWEGSAS